MPEFSAHNLTLGSPEIVDMIFDTHTPRHSQLQFHMGTAQHSLTAGCYIYHDLPHPTLEG